MGCAVDGGGAQCLPLISLGFVDMMCLLVLLTCCVYRHAVRSCGVTDETCDPKITTLHSLVSALGVGAPSAALQSAAEGLCKRCVCSRCAFRRLSWCGVALKCDLRLQFFARVVDALGVVWRR